MRNLLLLLLVIPNLALATPCGLDHPAFPGTAETDADGDGYSTDGAGFLPGIDCDDSDWQMYPDIWQEVGGQYQKCDGATGTFTALQAEPFDLNATGGRFYLDCDAPTNGTGTFASPWNTPEMFTYLFASQQPPGYHMPVCGDIFVISGTCSEGFDADPTAADDALRILGLRGVDCTGQEPIEYRALPGATAVLQGSQTLANRPIQMFQSGNVLIEGLEVTGDIGLGSCISVGSTGLYEIRNNNVHDCYANHTSNVAGINLSDSVGSYVHHNRVYDNFDKNQAAGTATTINDRNIVLFRGDDNRVDFNSLGYTDPAKTPFGYCLGYKHGNVALQDTSTWQASHNILVNCPGGIETSQAGSSIFHNYIEALNVGVSLDDVGGPTFINNILVEDNTILAPTCLSVDFRSGDLPPTNNIFQNNICVASNGAYGPQEGIVIDTNFGTDALYATTSNTGAIDYIGNIYWNQGVPTQFSHYSSSTAPAGPAGDEYTFAQWQAADTVAPNNKPAWDDVGATFFDTSFEEDPLLDSCDRAVSDNARFQGYRLVQKVISVENVVNLSEPNFDGSFDIVLSLPAPTSGSVQLQINNDATPGFSTFGVDWGGINIAVPIAQGETVVTVPVEVIDDSLVEGAEQIEIQLAQAIGLGSDCVVNPGADRANLVINDDDTDNQVNIGNPVDLAEPATGGSFDITFDNPTLGSGVVTVSMTGSATAGLDYTPTITIPYALGATSVSVPVNILDDSLVEGVEDIVVSIISISDPAIGIDIAESSVVLEIADDEQPETLGANWWRRCREFVCKYAFCM